ncbi:MAG TPA: tetratricopeptide repeat protein [Thermoanaerobaculia bacterium]|jgi:tetratricopeptide (TPR) repeat protein
MRAQAPANPFPGLRPFEPDEDHFFFGRETHTDELQRRLRSHRFLSVVGTSGSGKSSLVRSGLIPALQSGFMVTAGSSWRVAMFRPGENPIGHLAAVLNERDVLGATGELAETSRVLLEATLYRGTLGLVDAVRHAHIARHDNLLLVVDQFEELFRFRRSRQIANAKDEALIFVKLLLEAAKQHEIPIYVVITMRSDFIGDCMEYPGLAEAINDGQYLIPRMTRDELRSAITGPVAVGGRAITPRLVQRLLNDLGEDQDQLPLLQHALMRTWGRGSETLDIVDYEGIGTIGNALSLHAEEAYQESVSVTRAEVVERIFKALTDTFSDPRGVRRPTTVKELAAICEAAEAEVTGVLEVFRRPGRSFLMPPASVPLDSTSMVDLSHESLMRCWTRLIHWADEEKAAAGMYVRLSQGAAWFEQGSAGLWRSPELELGLQWREQNRPTAAWARRYDSSFPRAMEFLEHSRKERDRIETEREAWRRQKLRRARLVAGVLGGLLIVAVLLGYSAQRQKNRAEQNLLLARNAVNVIVSSASQAHAQESAEMPEVEQLRQELLAKAQPFYLVFAHQAPENAELRQEAAWAHSRLGDINRLLDKPEDAVREYKIAIDEFQRLANDDPRKAEYRRELAYSLNWLGETLRVWLRNSPGVVSHQRAEAEHAYDKALILQQELHRQSPRIAEYRQELGRTYYNRGIFRYDGGDLKNCEADFREAIRLLEPLPASQDLARAYNNLATLMSDTNRSPEARSFYERAIAIEEALARGNRSRQYRTELATFYNNLSFLSWNGEEIEAAKQRNRQALGLIGELVVPASPLEEQRAKAVLLRTLLRQSLQPELQIMYTQLADRYVEVARQNLTSGAVSDAEETIEGLNALLVETAEPDRTRLSTARDDLRRQLAHIRKGSAQ